jgi:hypothetical protein
VKENNPMKKLSFDVEGLTEEQIELARQFIELMKRAKDRERAFTNLKRLLGKGARGAEQISEEEANRIAAEAAAYARKNL